MAHGDGGRGNVFPVGVGFAAARRAVGSGLEFQTARPQLVRARQGESDTTPPLPTISFRDHGTVCEHCWGYRVNCSGTRVGHCVEALCASL